MLKLRSMLKGGLAAILLSGAVFHQAVAADACRIVNYSKKRNEVTMRSLRTTTLRFTVPNRGSASPSQKRVRAGQQFKVRVSGYPLIVTDLDAGRNCANQVIP